MAKMGAKEVVTRLVAAALAPTDEDAAAEADEVREEIQGAARTQLKAKADEMKAKRLAAGDKKVIETTGETSDHRPFGDGSR